MQHAEEVLEKIPQCGVPAASPACPRAGGLRCWVRQPTPAARGLLCGAEVTPAQATGEPEAPPNPLRC